MTEEHTIERALRAQLQALEALEQKAREEPSTATLKELSMCARRYGQMATEYILERRLKELEEREAR